MPGSTTQRASRRKRKRTTEHSRTGRQVRNNPDHLYYKLYSWYIAKHRDHSQPSVQLCSAPTGTKCPDLSSYKAAPEIWWRPEDAMLSYIGRHSSKKRKKLHLSL